MPQPPVQFDARSALVFAALLLGLGLLGLLRRRNMLLLLMAVELILAAPTVAFVALARGRNRRATPGRYSMKKTE